MESNVIFRIVKSEKIKPEEDQKLLTAKVSVWRKVIPILSYQVGNLKLSKAIRNGIDELQTLGPEFEDEIMGIMVSPEDADEITPVIKELAH